jgi:hypothetical protein
LYD